PLDRGRVARSRDRRAPDPRYPERRRHPPRRHEAAREPVRGTRTQGRQAAPPVVRRRRVPARAARRLVGGQPAPRSRAASFAAPAPGASGAAALARQTARGTGKGDDTSKPLKEAVEEARVRFQRGTQVFNDGAYKLALIEFQRAYSVMPNWRVLFNVGAVHVQ